MRRAPRLDLAISNYRRAANRERFVVRVTAVVQDGIEEVFDVSVPGINAFDANGLIVHNCGEQPLPPYGACLLGSINLARLIDKPFTAEARLDTARLEALAATAVRFLDDVIDISNYPLPAQRTEAKAKRRIGLGVTGLADALILAGARYGSPQSLALAKSWMAAIEAAAYAASAELAREKGAFPLYDARAFPGGAERPAPARRGARGDSAARHPQRPPHLHRADRHHLAARRQRLLRHRAGVRLPLRAPRAGARRLRPHRDGGGLRARPLPPDVRRPARR